MRLINLIAFIVFGVLPLESFAQSTYEVVLKAKSCSEWNQQTNCDYKIGSSFWLSISGIGQPDTGVTFMKADFDGIYYGTYGVMHGCIVIKPGKANKTKNLADFAFVSPKNGKVYSDWKTCQAGY
jgi:hypothetical protein